jgi:acyl-CoA synthetase (AMP-forming)/AMP-acid ligase II
VRIEDFLLESERRAPDHIALVCGESRISYRRLAADAARLANVMRRRSVCRGERVAILLDNCPEAVVAIFAALEAGAVFTVLDPATRPDRLAEILNDCEARAVITERKLLPVAAQAISLAPSVSETFIAPYAALLEAGADIAPPNVGVDLDLALLFYADVCVSPQGAMLTHQSVVFAINELCRHLRYATDADACLDLPLASCEGLYRMLAAVYRGVTLVLGKAPKAAASAAYWHPECGPCTYLPAGQRARSGSVGIPIRGTEAYVVDETGGRVAHGVTGELVIRGAQLMKGYWGDPAGVAQRLRPGPYPWERVLFTGEQFRTDSDGYLYSVARQDGIEQTDPPPAIAEAA